MFKKTTAVLAICLWSANSHAGIIYDIDSVLNIGGTDIFGSGFVDVAPAALTANSEIVFSSGSILDFSFAFEDVLASPLDISSATTEGFQTDMSGEIISFIDTGGTFADFFTAFDPTTGLGRGVFFAESGFGFNARSNSTAGALVTGGSYSITRRVDPAPAPAPATLALFGLGIAGLGWSRRKHQRC